MSKYKVGVLLDKKVNYYIVASNIVKVEGNWLVFYNDVEYKPVAIFSYTQVLYVFEANA